MIRLHKRFALVLFALILTAFSLTPRLSAEDHVVPQTSLHQALMNAARTRRRNIAQVEGFFAAKPVQKALQKSGLNIRQVRSAVPTLNDRELAQLARRTRKVQNDFAAGALSNERLTYIVIAMATAIVVILIFEA
jgi:hypothetical protein